MHWNIKYLAFHILKYFFDLHIIIIIVNDDGVRWQWVRPTHLQLWIFLEIDFF